MLVGTVIIVIGFALIGFIANQHALSEGQAAPGEIAPETEPVVVEEPAMSEHRDGKGP